MILLRIIGCGNVAQHFLRAFEQSTNVCIVEIYNRSIEKLTPYKSKYNVTTEIENTKNDVTIICTSDISIHEVSQRIPVSNSSIIAHTSGANYIDILERHPRRAVFYPLNSFHLEHKTNFKTTPICIEASRDSDYGIIEKLARSISDEVYCIKSEIRRQLHLAAVFANNFTNHMVYISEQICKKNQIPFEILSPLIESTFEKLKHHSPFDSQTGPAKRKDRETLKKHLEIINPLYKEIYKLISNSIIKSYDR